MPLLISDEQLKQAGLTEQDARLELACRLFDANRLTLHQAATWVGLDRVSMESELLSRGISVYRFHDEDGTQVLSFRELREADIGRPW